MFQRDPASCRAETLVGVWDATKGKVTLGGLLLFLYELNSVADHFKCSSKKIHLIGDDSTCLNVLPLVQEVLSSTEGFLLDTDVTCLEEPSALRWPQDLFAGDYEYTSTIQLQKIFASTGKLSPIIPSFKICSSFENELFLKYDKKPYISVHLKESTEDPGRNARITVWNEFFESIAPNNCTFFIVGNEPLDDLITQPHVIRTKELGFSLSQQLVLIMLSRGFIGMASGPSNAALITNIPYFIIKHPDHHSISMQAELGKSDCLPFANNSQKIVRAFEDVRLLHKAKKIIT